MDGGSHTGPRPRLTRAPLARRACPGMCFPVQDRTRSVLQMVYKPSAIMQQGAQKGAAYTLYPKPVLPGRWACEHAERSERRCRLPNVCCSPLARGSVGRPRPPASCGFETGTNSAKSHLIVTLYSTYTRALTFHNFLQRAHNCAIVQRQCARVRGRCGGAGVGEGYTGGKTV